MKLVETEMAILAIQYRRMRQIMRTFRGNLKQMPLTFVVEQVCVCVVDHSCQEPKLRRITGFLTMP